MSKFDKSTLAGLKLRMEVLVWRHGWAWLLLPVLLLGLLCVYGGLVAPARSLQAEQQAQWRAMTDPAVRVDQQRTPLEQLARAQDQLRNVLIPATQVDATLLSMHALARGAGIRIDQAEFTQVSSGIDGVQRLQIHMPVRGTYLAIQPFVLKLLREHPALTVDHISLKRERVEQDQADVRLKFSIWIQKTDVDNRRQR